MESWIDSKKYPKYQVSTHGRIRNRETGLVLKDSLDRYGYPRLTLGNTRNVSVHRLVCEEFYGAPPNENSQVNHIDGNRSNNHVLNLEWCSPSKNIKWGVMKGTIKPSIGLEKALEVNKKPVRIPDLNKTFDSVKDCAEFLGVRPTNVSRCLVGERKGRPIHGHKVEFV